eukprot:4395726-Pleurochrysis_carterae.AAC.1
MAEATEQCPGLAALFAAGSEAAVEAAVAHWEALVPRAARVTADWEGRPPAGWPAAARRLVA